jgi:hypothetical protein
MPNLFPPNLRWLGAHPGADELMAYLDGELSETNAAQVRQHLAKCAPCQQKAAETENLLLEIHDVVSWTARDDVPAQEALVGLQKAIQSWNADHRARGVEGVPLADTDLGRRLADVLQVYLGNRATSALLAQAGRDEYADEKLMTEIGPMLRTFLGRESADALEEQMRNILRTERDRSGLKPAE